MNVTGVRHWGVFVVSLLAVVVLAALSLAPWWLTVVVGVLWGLMLLGDELNMWGGQ